MVMVLVGMMVMTVIVVVWVFPIVLGLFNLIPHQIRIGFWIVVAHIQNQGQWYRSILAADQASFFFHGMNLLL